MSHDTGVSERKRAAQHYDRWSGYETNDQIVSVSEKLTAAEMKRFELFESYHDPLLESISPDVAIVEWKEGAALFEEGTYIDVAFYVVSGRVALSIEQFGGSLPEALPIFDLSRTLEGESNLSVADLQSGADTADGNSIVMLSTVDVDLSHGATLTLGEGEIFGEIGALSGWPQSVTARTLEPCTLIQVRLPALRQLKRKNSKLKKRLDAIYRERSLRSRLRRSPLFQECDADFIDSLAEEVELLSCDPDEVVTAQGDPADCVYLVRSGFLSLTQRFGEADRVVSYLSKGMLLGEVEYLVEGITQWEVSARSVEYCELVKIPISAVSRLLEQYPSVEERLWRMATSRIKEAGAGRRDPAQGEFTEIALDTGLVQGNSILVIDLDTCTRCDDCVRGCAAAHGGRPRFVREGDKVGNLLVAHSCYHCQDPVCLVGCPTGAIHRSNVGHVVSINDHICIGCASCSDNCPYDNIVMHETNELWPDDMVPESLRGEPRMVASKCDLCQDTGHGPACVSNCPQGCASRVGSLDQFVNLVNRRR